MTLWVVQQRNSRGQWYLRMAFETRATARRHRLNSIRNTSMPPRDLRVVRYEPSRTCGGVPVRQGAASAEGQGEMRCAYCGKPAEGNFSVHRDGLCDGPEVDLCDACGEHETPTLPQIWQRIAKRPAQRHGEDK